MKTAHKADAPIQYGELIEGTNLRRRYQNGREICPEYVGPERTAGQAGDAAEAQCAANGLRAYRHWHSTYVQIGSSWYTL